MVKRHTPHDVLPGSPKVPHPVWRLRHTREHMHSYTYIVGWNTLKEYLINGPSFPAFVFIPEPHVLCNEL